MSIATSEGARSVKLVNYTSSDFKFSKKDRGSRNPSLQLERGEGDYMLDLFRVQITRLQFVSGAEIEESCTRGNEPITLSAKVPISQPSQFYATYATLT